MDRNRGISDRQQDDGQMKNVARFLPAAGVVVAAFSFMITTVVYRLVQQTRAVEAAVHEGIAGMNRLASANGSGLSSVRQGLADQVAASAAMEMRLEAVESTGRSGIERLESLAAIVARQAALHEQTRNDLERLTVAIDTASREVLERIALDADRNATAHEGLARDVNAAVAHMERTLAAQSDDFRVQKRQFDAAAERDRATRRAMLHEATRTFAVQVEGLRQMLDGLRIEAGLIGEGDAAETLKEVVDRSGDSEVEEIEPSGHAGEPTTAARDTEAVLE